jgi:hypothetical protein
MAGRGSLLSAMAALAGADGKRVIRRRDQRKIRAGWECLRVSMRGGERALPVAWKVKKGKGHLGCEEQKWRLDAVGALRPRGLSLLLAADRC